MVVASVSFRICSIFLKFWHGAGSGERGVGIGKRHAEAEGAGATPDDSNSLPGKHVLE